MLHSILKLRKLRCPIYPRFSGYLQKGVSAKAILVIRNLFVAFF